MAIENDIISEFSFIRLFSTSRNFAIVESNVYALCSVAVCSVFLIVERNVYAVMYMLF